MDLGTDGDVGSINDLLGGDAGTGTTSATGSDAGGGDAGASGGGGDGSAPDWYGSLSAEAGDGETASNRDYVQAKGFKDLDGLVKAYRHAEKGLHESGRIKIPGEGATDQEIAEYRAAIGVPNDPSGYAVPEFKDAAGNAIPINTELTQRIFAKAHELGGPKGLVEQLVAAEIEAQIAEHDAAVLALQKQANEHIAKWGPEKDAGIAAVNAAMKELGFSRQDVDHMRAMPSGVGKFLDAMRKLGGNFTEDSLVKGDRKTFGMSPEAAQAEIKSLLNDAAFVEKSRVPGSAEAKRFERLNNLAAGIAA